MDSHEAGSSPPARSRPRERNGSFLRAGRGAGRDSGVGSILTLARPCQSQHWTSASIGLTKWLTASSCFLAQAGYQIQILPFLICGSSREITDLGLFLSFNTPWRLTGPQTGGEQCAVLEDEEA